MFRRATEGTCLAELVQMGIPICRAAQRHRPRTGPGRPPDYDDWMTTVMIMVAVLKKRKTKSAQYRFLWSHQQALRRWLHLDRFPARSTSFDRYRHAHRLDQAAIRLQGRKALQEAVADARSVGVDKSLIAAKGPRWNRKDRRAGRIPPGLHGVDTDSTWGFSADTGWVQGYSYDGVVTATRRTTVFPLLASVDTAHTSEFRSLTPQIDQLPPSTRYVLADSGYDSNAHGERIEYDAQGRRTPRRFLCPANPRRTGKGGHRQWAQSHERQWAQRRRQRRRAFLNSRRGQRLYARRGLTVEPFNDWLRSLFELGDHEWHRGLDNNRPQILAAIICYQLLLRYNRRHGRPNGQVQWILDAL